MIAIIASLPLAISALSFFLRSSGSAIDGAFGTPKGPNTQPLKLLDLIVVSPTTKRDDNLPGIKSGSW